MSKLAIIYGYNQLNFSNQIPLDISNNKYGEISSPVLSANIDDSEILLLNRHGYNFKHPPHLINYKANLYLH